MNKTKLLLTLALPVLMAPNTQAQSRLTAQANRTHNGAEFMRADSTSYTYLSATRGGDLKNQLKFDNGTMWVYLADTLTNNMRWVQEFDGSNRLTTKVSQNWDGMVTMNWMNQFRYLYTYTSAGKVATMITQHWDGTSAWITDSKNEYTYNPAGQLSMDQFQTWDGISAYVPSSQVTYYYDVAGNVINATSNTFVASTPVFTAKTDNTYSTTNKMLTQTNSNWNGAGWDVVDMTTNTYDTSGRRTSELYQLHDGTALVNDMMKLFSGFTGANPTTEIDQTWDTAGTGSWKDTYKFAYTYNGAGQLTSATRQSNDISIGWTYALGDTRANYYYNTFTSVKHVRNIGGTATLFPVPVQNTLNITVNWHTPQSSTITVTDMTGRIVKTMPVPHGASQFTTLPVDGLTAGNYIVTITGSIEGSIVNKVVVAH